MTHVTNADSNTTTLNVLASPRLLRAAISGFVAASGVAGCGDDTSSDHEHATSDPQELSDEELRALCADMVEEAKSENSAGSGTKEEDLDLVCKDKVEEAKKSGEANIESLCAEPVKTAVDSALKPKTAEEKTTSSEQKEYTFAQLTKMCDDRGGYIEIHGSCGGVNSCKGFSYGDWGPDAAILTEHSCTGTNGCLGLSCVLGTAEGKYAEKSGEDLYGHTEFEGTVLNNCSGCHAPGTDPTDHSKKDLTSFHVYVQPGQTARNEKNWLDMPASAQERMVFFGTHFTDAKGRQVNDMASYKSVLTRKDVERVVAHIRTLKPVMKVIKMSDTEK